MENKITKNIMKLPLMIVASVLLLIPKVLAYSNVYYAPDLYAVFVESVFGGFWLSVLALGFIMYVILAFIGRVSQWTAFTFIAFFVLTMAIGYTQPIIIVPLFGGMVLWSIKQWIDWLSNRR